MYDIISTHINALYHKVVPCEIQIRTSFQDGWATKSHLLAYKMKDIPPRWQRHFRLLNDQLHFADEIADLLREELLKTIS